MKISINFTSNIPSPHPLHKRIVNLLPEAEKIANDVLNLAEDVAIIVDDNMDMVDPNIGVGGYTDSKNQISLSIDPVKVAEVTDDEIFATIIHELSHVKRAYGPWYGTTLFDYIIFEGLGVAFEEEVCGDKTYYQTHLRTTLDGSKLVDKFSHMFDLDDSGYNYLDFVVGNKELGIPSNAVYAMGLHIVDSYIKSSGKKASDLLLNSSDIFRTQGSIVKFSTDYWQRTESLVEFIPTKTMPTGIPATASKLIAFTKEGLLLVKSPKGWDIPGGHIEGGETATEALEREVNEETGGSTSDLQPIGYVRITNTKENKLNKNYPKVSCIPIYTGHVTGILSGDKLSHESTDAQYFPLNNLPEDIADWSQMSREVIDYASIDFLNS